VCVRRFGTRAVKSMWQDQSLKLRLNRSAFIPAPVRTAIVAAWVESLEDTAAIYAPFAPLCEHVSQP
jgi:hypothetical protein